MVLIGERAIFGIRTNTGCPSALCRPDSYNTEGHDNTPRHDVTADRGDILRKGDLLLLLSL